MEKKIFRVPNIGCNGCVNTIKNELNAMPGVHSVEGSAENKTVVVEYDAPATWEQIAVTLKEIDYAPEEA